MIQCTLRLYNQKHSGDGVYRLTKKYTESTHNTAQNRVHDADKITDITSYGRQYTLRGDAVNPNATVLQFIPFGASDELNFLLINSDLMLLNDKFEHPDTNSSLIIKHLQ